MLSKLRLLALSAALVFALGGLGYAGGTALAPQPAQAHHVPGCSNSICLSGDCEFFHNCGCVDTDGDGMCDATGKCELDSQNCGLGDGFPGDCDDPRAIIC